MLIALSFPYRCCANKILHVTFECTISPRSKFLQELITRIVSFLRTVEETAKNVNLKTFKLFCPMVEVIMQKYM